MYDQYKAFVFDEEDSLLFKGQWRKKVFNSSLDSQMDLEIGPGSGGFFSYMAEIKPERLFLAIELKYKPLIQTARKVKNKNGLNAKVIRYNARMLKDLFAKEELNNIYIHFPDPWPKKRHHKHRLIKPEFVQTLYKLQRKNSFVEVKTDHEMYFREIYSVFKNSPYKELEYSEDLHKNYSLNEKNFITPFEKIFIRKNQPIYYLKQIK